MIPRLTAAWRRLLVAFAAALMLPLSAAALATAPQAAAFSRAGLPVEYLDVYSAAMGRNVRVEFQPGGARPPTSSPGGARPAGPQKAVYLLDGMRAPDDYNSWDVETPAFEWFHESGIAVVMPVGGQASFYTDWYSPSDFNRQPFTYKWETFLTAELPQWLAANKQVSATANGIVGVGMSGGAALVLAAHHPQQFVYAASLSGYLNPTERTMQQAIRVAMIDAGGYNVDNMWGPPWDVAWQRNDPVLAAASLARDGTRLWISCAPGADGPVADDQTPNAHTLEALAIGSTKAFEERYRQAGGRNATFDFAPAASYSWSYWGAQLQALKPDLIATLDG